MTYREYIGRVLTALALAALAAVLWQLSAVLMLAFGAIVLAVALRAVADELVERLGLGETLALVVTVTGFLLLTGSVGYLFATRILAQLGSLGEQLTASLRALLDAAGISGPQEMLSAVNLESLAGQIMFLGRNIIELATGVLFLVVSGIYMAIRPRPYVDGFVALFPPVLQERIKGTLQVSGEAIRLWFFGQLIAMTFVGVLFGLAMWLIGLPTPLALGFIAGLSDFVPLVGPVIGFVPALLVASSMGLDVVLWTLLAAVVVQQIENHVVVPQVVRYTVAVPPAVGAFAVLAFGSLLGMLGAIFGYPLAIVTDVVVRRLYVREALQEPVEIAAEQSAGTNAKDGKDAA